MNCAFILFISALHVLGPVMVTGQDTPRSQRRGFISFEQFDKNGDGKISRLEFPGPLQFFERMDVNHDGFLTLDEVERSRRDRQDRPALGDTLLKVLDLNGDGKVSVLEFAGIANFFAQLDKDEDGSLTGEELSILASLQSPSTEPDSTEPDIEALFEQFDTNRDGKLSEEELRAAPQFDNPRFFALLDHDQDRFVTKDELSMFLRGSSVHPKLATAAGSK